MEAAQVPSQDGPQDAAETQEAPQAQVPPEVMQRLDELNGRFGQLEPVLQQFAQQQQPQEETQETPGWDDYVDPDTGYVIDPNGLEQSIQQRIQQGIEQAQGPLAQQMQQMQQFLQDQELDGLMEDYPELQDQGKAQALAQRANEYAASRGIPQLATDPEFVEMVYLAGKAMEQAQQGVPAGDQGVHLEGGSGNPGEPQVNATQEAFGQLAQQGAGGGVWGKRLGLPG